METRAAVGVYVLAGLVLSAIAAFGLIAAPSLRIALGFLACASWLGAYATITPRELWPPWLRPLQISFVAGSVALAASYALWGA